jgi:hypothetical protein
MTMTTTTATKYPEYDRAVALADLIERRLPKGWGTATAVGTTNGRAHQNVIVSQRFNIGDPLPSDPDDNVLRYIWSVAREYANAGMVIELNQCGAVLSLVGGAA